jgi:predicted DNA-binding transcriptional regulator YafY
MNRLDRTMGILLLLRGGRIVSATDLAARFEVSIRTIYRDIEVLSGLGVPVGVEMGRTGGFRLREGYFLPPVTLGPEEAASLLLGLILMKRLRVMPFPKEADFAERKLLAALPPETKAALERASRFIGFESVPPDLLHPELDDPKMGLGPPPDVEGGVVGAFLRALLARSRVTLAYHSPHRAREAAREVEPLGLVWDRDRWYLVGRPEEGKENRMWRADRVVDIGPGRSMPPLKGDFDVAEILDRLWLKKAMERWRQETSVKIAMRPDQAERLKRDWYYGLTQFEEDGEGRVVMSYGEYWIEAASALVRWLGPGAELLEPVEWRDAIAAELEALLAAHRRGGEK